MGLTPLQKRPRELPCLLCSRRVVKTYRLWTGKWVLTKHRFCQGLDFGLLSQKREKELSVVYELLGLRCSLTAAQAKKVMGKKQQ